jgi:hypothetical protein
MTRATPAKDPGLVWVHPLPDAYVMGEPHVSHQVTPERAAELVGAPIPAFTLTPPDEEAATVPATAGVKEV